MRSGSLIFSPREFAEMMALMEDSPTSMALWHPATAKDVQARGAGYQGRWGLAHVYLSVPIAAEQPPTDPMPLVAELRERKADYLEKVGEAVGHQWDTLMARAEVMVEAIALAKQHANWPTPVPLPTHEGYWAEWADGEWDKPRPVYFYDGDARWGTPFSSASCMTGHYIPAPPAPVGVSDV